jgi:hypothetical protein
MPITLNGDTGITPPIYGGADAAECLVPVTDYQQYLACLDEGNTPEPADEDTL